MYAAFYNGKLKGFVSAEPEIFGGEQEYCDLSNIHISEDMRNQGIGRTLFLAAKEWAVLKPKFIIKNMLKQNRMIVS